MWIYLKTMTSPGNNILILWRSSQKQDTYGHESLQESTIDQVQRKRQGQLYNQSMISSWFLSIWSWDNKSWQ